ncbi:hypothetical protein BJ165DRAFT_1480239 [Panaeolus papilionaceus]|nr:hypothetical protein BJ165DRAFT_1480239 [Panaeolus papilionaceus]
MGMSQSQNNEEEMEEHIPSEEEVEEVKSILMIFLPKELADIITDEAEFWLCATSEHNYGGQPYRVEADMTTNYDKQRCCAISPEMSSLIPRPFFHIRCVRFIISSHDQGWGGEPNLQGDYEGSWTWFEAKIVRPKPGAGDDEPVREPFIMGDLDMDTEQWTTTVQNPYAHKQKGGTEDSYVLDGKGDSWTIQLNLRANGEFEEHAVVWRWDDELDIVNENRRLDEEGIGQGAGFVEALGKGDRIAVMARARYPGWVNFVKSVTIQVFYSI